MHMATLRASRVEFFCETAAICVGLSAPPCDFRMVNTDLSTTTARKRLSSTKPTVATGNTYGVATWQI
jgi:hypothetical protein